MNYVIPFTPSPSPPSSSPGISAGGRCLVGIQMLTRQPVNMPENTKVVQLYSLSQSNMDKQNRVLRE